MNTLSLETLFALNEVAGVVVEVNDGSIVRMSIEGDNDNE